MAIEKHPVGELVDQIAERKTLFSRPDRLDQRLHVVMVVYNTTRYKRRWQLYEDTAKHIQEGGAVLHTVEIAYGDRAFAVTEAGNPNDIQLRTNCEICHKERAINLCIGRMDLSITKVAWIDADTHFVNYDWADKTLHKLEHYNFVQMFSQANDLDPKGNIMYQGPSFAKKWTSGAYPKNPKTSYYYGAGPGAGEFESPGWTGLAWGARREALDAVGGLIDYSLMGAADWYMAHAMVGRLKDAVYPTFHPHYLEMMYEWQARCTRLNNSSPRGMLGVVDGACLHYWHGKKADRHYETRDQILYRLGYDPYLDLKPDSQGLWQLTTRIPELRDAIAASIRQRNEDSIDL